MSRSDIVRLILRVGVAFPFLYAAVDAFLQPYSWVDFFPQCMRGVVPDLVLLNSFGILEIIIALWILSGKKICIPSVCATLLLLAIVYVNLPLFQLLFRDVAIAAMALALAVDSFPRTKIVT